MRDAITPEILTPQKKGRLGGGAGAFRDENLDLLSRVLDTWFRVPGTQIRFGLDGIVGFFPGVGDFIGGAASCIIVLAAFFRGVPMITIARMVVNLVIEVGVGMVPVLGNLFDIGWRANRRNYHLLENSLQGPVRDTVGDWLFMGVLALLLLALAMVPFLLLLWIGDGILKVLHAPGM
ncbi:DUF4112 domain-containing protein [Granulicella sp. 5B5]|uniref:DUF4112 domain-containing protein n=1 Tax=Granulicella sp. 5B5 TaxID=1617967 RepID=UPI0015F54503|nr:DUF4112 domain-containing protein [Granulicella sp. 5B5]QMV19708.1 DUF4112 domain-containing protein [Granulicella sp. 5B5]